MDSQIEPGLLVCVHAFVQTQEEERKLNKMASFKREFLQNWKQSLAPPKMLGKYVGSHK